VRNPISVVVTDLDNTLFDWVEIWHRSFSALVGELHLRSGVPIERLLSDAREVHRRVGTSEYAFLAEELACLQEAVPAEAREEIIRAANDARRVARNATTHLYQGVRETLEELQRTRVLVVGYTESGAYYTNRRVRRLGLDGLLDRLYSPPDHDLPPGYTREAVRRYPDHQYHLKQTAHRYTPAGELKPNPRLLLDILDDVGALPGHAVYVGDSPMKDVAMARDAGVADVLALYGKAQDREAYELLRRVTHWTDEDVERERRILERAAVKPSYVLEHSFAEMLELFSFTPFVCRERDAQAVA
jgi:phosphoglycolate phosphatase